MGKGDYGVKLVRGPVVDPSPNSLACTSEEDLRNLLRTAFVKTPRAVDLFCGAGGMSIGLADAGYTVVLGIDTQDEALNTHRSLCPGLSVGWDLSDPSVVDHVGHLVKDLDIQLIAGGPPCQPFSKAGRSMLRHLVTSGRRDAEDLRARLWRSLLRVVEIARPEAVLMENVPDMVLDRDMLVLRSMTEELEVMGYAVEARLVDTYRYGVPQFRQRLILVALSDHRKFSWPQEVETPVRLVDAIGDLPPVEGGWRAARDSDGSQHYVEPSDPSAFVVEMRRGLHGPDRSRIHDHITRPVREDDKAAFAVMGPETKYSELPEELRRYRHDIFDDKYKRLDWHDFCRTITAHIAKDGYWYIHPEQDRTLTIREAARVQTFPDHVRFAGPPTAAFKQIGNAVPPRAAGHIAREIRLSIGRGHPAGPTTQQLSADLAAWAADHPEQITQYDPGLGVVAAKLLTGHYPDVSLRWPTLVSQLLLVRIEGKPLIDAWSILTTTLSTPRAALERDAVLQFLATTLDRRGRLDVVREVRDALIAGEGSLASPEGLERLPGVSRALARLVCRLVPGQDSDPIVSVAPLLRLAARYFASTVDEQDKMSAGRLAIARLVGADDEEATDPLLKFRAALSSIALHTLADAICTPREPSCAKCPLQVTCEFALANAVQPDSHEIVQIGDVESVSG